MITVRTSPAYVNRVRQDWTANGGVYGDGGVYAVVPSNDPFAQLGPTLDLTFAGVPTDQLTAATADGYSINLNLSSEIYQIAAQYTVWTATGLTQVNFADVVTFTRGSTATYFNSAGTLTTAAINEARFDYNPSTLAAQGLLIEEQRTNSIRNNTMQGAVAGTPGTNPTNWGVTGIGLTQTIVGTGTENGITYIDIRLSGTTTGQFGNVRFEPNNNVVAAAGQSWAGSAYLKLVAGSLTNIAEVGVVLYAFTSAPAFISSTQTPAAVSASLTRFSHVGTMPATTGFVQPAVYFNTTAASGQAVDITLRIGLPQLEQGAFATSVIPTTTTALTRSADVASVNTLSPWFNSTAGTLFTESLLTRQNATADNQTATIRNPANTSQIKLVHRGSGATGQLVIDTAVIQADLTATGVISANTTVKMALAYAANDFAASGNGGAVVTDTSGTVPSGLDQMTLGALGLNGYLRRLTYYPRRLPNADLQTITA